MTRIERKTYVMRSITAATDKVIGGVTIPQDGVLHNVSGQIHLVVPTALGIEQAVMYGIGGWLMNGMDPDTTDTYDDIWDRFVPKDEDILEAAAGNQLDLDTAVAVTAPAFEPGEPRVEALVGAMPAGRFLRNEKLISFANSKGGFDKTSEDYFPSDALDPFAASPNMFTDDWAAAMIAVSAPAQDDVTTSIFSTPTGSAEWMALKYIDDVVESAWKQMVGLTEAGAESPFGDLTRFLENATEPTVVEESAGSFVATVWRVFARLVWDYEVPGSIKKIGLKSA